MGQANDKGEKPKNQNEENVEKVNSQSEDPQDKINDNVSQEEIKEGMIHMSGIYIADINEIIIKYLQIPLPMPSILQTLLLLMENCMDRISLS